MNKINYRKITGKELFGMFKESFRITKTLLKENDDIKMWIKKDNNIFYLKNVDIDRFYDLSFDFDFNHTEEKEKGIDELITFVKLKRAFLSGKSKKIKFNGFEMEKRIKMESWRKYSFNHIEKNYKLHISSHNYFISEYFETIFEDYFDGLTLSSKKKLHKFMSHLLCKKNINTMISLWNHLNNSFNLTFRILVDGGGKHGKIRFDSSIYIDTKERIHMKQQSDVYLKYLKTSKTNRRDITGV